MAQTDIKAALAKLDVSNDNHWTDDGLPRLETLRFLAGDQKITREQVSTTSPGFSRATAAQGVQGAATQLAAATPAPTQEPVLNAPQGLPNVEDVQVERKPDATDDEVSAARATLEACNVRVAEATRLKEDADKAYTLANKEADVALAKLEEMLPPDSNSAAIRQYLDGQVALLEVRRERINQMKGINLSEILPKRAPIDTAMQRRTGFGGKRPSR